MATMGCPFEAAVLAWQEGTVRLSILEVPIYDELGCGAANFRDASPIKQPYEGSA